MKKVCAAVFVALFLLSGAMPVSAQDVTLSSHDGNVEISGNLLGFDGEFYRVETIYGELTVDGSGVVCTGPGCPDLEAFVARVTFSGSPTIGRLLMPALLEAFAIREGYDIQIEPRDEAESVFVLVDSDADRVVGEFAVRLTNSDEGFADLFANVGDIAMSMREIRPEEVALARDAGLGDLTGRGRARVMALDALVPVVSPSNPVQSITLPDLSAVLSGKITNWANLGGPDAPIAVHLYDQRTGLGQVSEARLLRPVDASPADKVLRHPNGSALAAAVMADPFALGVTSQAEAGNTWPLDLSGSCGFALGATRRAVKTEDYPLTVPMFLYLPARRLPKLVRDFLSYLPDPSAQLVIRRAGFVDQMPEEIPINAQGDRFANAIARAGQDISLGDLKRMVEVLSPLKRLTTTFRFETGSARLDAQSRSNVQQLARALELGLYDARRIVFVGFSDGEGPAAANQRIAAQRADTVRKAVVAAAETANVTRLSVETEAFGEAMPMACDDTSWGRSINRRVEIWVR